MGKTRAEQAQLTKDRIMEAATKLFSKKGFDDVSMQDIAKAANCTAGNIYHYFGSKEDVSTRTFTTKAYYSSGYPFIYLNSAERDSSGKFVSGTKIPLRVYNARNVAKVEWYFGDKSISSALTGYYTVTSSGELKAIVYYEDGSSDIICKTVTVK